MVKAEAIEVLYDTTIIRGGSIDLDIVLQSHNVCSRVRRVEIIDVLDCTYRHNPDEHKLDSRHLRKFLEPLQPLPRLRLILISSDCLTAETRFVTDSWTSVSDFVHEVEHDPATCVDVGRYQLYGKFKNIQIVNSKLVRMWPVVRDT